MPPAGEGFPPGLEAYSVQMHIHGHSHHNGAGRPGSMQWHSHFAAETGLDVLWWTDHSEMFDLSSPLRFDFTSNRLSGAPPGATRAGRSFARRVTWRREGFF